MTEQRCPESIEGLLAALKTRRIQVIREMEVIDREAAHVRQETESRLAAIRQRRLPLEERLRRIDALIELESGKEGE